MSIALVVTRGYGNGTLTGTIKDVVLSGYSLGAALNEPDYDGVLTLASITPVNTITSATAKITLVTSTPSRTLD